MTLEPDSEPKYPDVLVRVVGEDGNAFAIMGRVRKALKRHGVQDTRLKQYVDEATSGDYDHLLRTTMRWVTVL